SNLGALALLRDQPDIALGWLQQGLEVDPGHAGCLLNSGMALHKLQRSHEAITVLRRAVQADPCLPEAWNNLGVALGERHTAKGDQRSDGSSSGSANEDPSAATADADFEEAFAAYRRALELRPAYPEAARNLAVLLAEHGDPSTGEAVLRSLPEALCRGGARFVLAEMLRLQGRVAEALEIYAEVLAQSPADGHLRQEVGVALVLAGQADQALLVLMPLIAERPGDARPLVAAGAALQSLGQTLQAVAFFEQALVIDPDQVRARNLLGLCLNELGHHSEAIEQFRAGLRVAPKDLELRCNLAGALRCQGELAASMRVIKDLLEERPACREACNVQLFSCSIAGEELAPLALVIGPRYWNLVRRQPERSVVLKPGSALPSLSEAHSAPDPAQGLEAATTAPMPTHGNLGDQRLRIGFLSAEIGHHVVASFLSAFLEHYDRSRFAVELFAASRRFDATAERMAGQADQHWLLSGMARSRSRDLIRSRHLDVLVETSGFTRDSGIDLLAERCAPVQCHYIGYHATTGLDTIDWFIGDAETVPADFAPQFVEGLWRLPRPWLACRPDPDLPPAITLADDERPVLGSFNQLAKVREETLRHWLAALRAVPDAQLLIKDRSTADPAACERIRSFLTEGGVAAERITFLPAIGSWREHMAVYNCMDVALDATPWSSATTAFDALLMGVPLVAIRGGCTSARMSSGILRGLGRPEWIAESPEQFAAITARLCADLSAVRAGKQDLRRQMQASPLLDGADLSRALEQAFAQMQAATKKALK
ncbi:MAG: tetratricopeptide repeat protein, partial [Cyanobium sp.]